MSHPPPTSQEEPTTEKAAATAMEEMEATMDQEMNEANDDDDEDDAENADADDVTALQPEETEGTATPPALPTAASLDSKPSPRTSRRYVAVRVGYATRPSASDAGEGCSRATAVAVRNAIFLSWEDAKHFVESTDGDAVTGPYHPDAEWRSFDCLIEAEAYLKKVVMPSPPAPQLKRKNLKSIKKRKKATLKHALASSVSKTTPRNRGPPTKKWMRMHQLAADRKSTRGALAITPAELAELRRWIKYQRNSYRLYLQDAVGGAHSMTDEKVRLLSELGFDWIEGDGRAVETGRKRGRPKKVGAEEEAEEEEEPSSGIRQKWMEMFEQLKAYAERSGTTEIPKDAADEGSAALRSWCLAQKSRCSMMQKGQHGKGMTQEKIDLLKSIGFRFPPDWNVMYSKLLAYKKEHGHVRVAEQDDASLAKWVARQSEVLGRHLQGKSTRLSDEQVMKFLSLGLVGGRKTAGAQDVDSERDEKWNEMLLKLRAYKAEHGHCNPPTSLCTDLSNWVAAQRRMYNKLINGKPGKRAVLDAIKMQRLTELGFQFRPRGSYLTWEDQLEKLQKFKEEHGHCRVPVSHPILGSFVKLARREYKLKQQGNKSSMTVDRERDLIELGFIFEGGKTPQRREAMNKTWDERFEELLAFKEENGHTVVPQNSGRLGQWVHSQRVNYKKFKEGKPTSMTAEKALKLTEVGFCFNAADRFRGNKQEEKPSNEHYPMYHSEVPQLPTTEFVWRPRYTD